MMKGTVGLAGVMAILILLGVPAVFAADALQAPAPTSPRPLTAGTDVDGPEPDLVVVEPLVLSAGSSVRGAVEAATEGGDPVEAVEESLTRGISTSSRSEEDGALSPVVVGAASAGALAVLVGILAATWGGFRAWLLGSLLAPFFSRITKERVLDNEVRNRVHEAVLQNPGITIKEVHEAVGIGWGTTVYHLKRLEDERLIVSERHLNHRRYFKNGGGIVNEDKSAFAELKHERSHALARAVLATPGSIQRELCARVGISAPLATKYLHRMERADLVVRQRQWKEVKVFPTARLGRLVQDAVPTPVAAA